MSFLIFLNSVYIVELLVEDFWYLKQRPEMETLQLRRKNVNQQKYFQLYVRNPAKLISNQWLMQ